jgi:hypothetical protein
MRRGAMVERGCGGYFADPKAKERVCHRVSAGALTDPCTAS